ncbi:MAG TPA: hypothetical protein EYN89_12050, partial [Flavobacteriales bacterium]|nr:hypothetical protein [Flavobacteriales bacterium]
ASWSVSIWAFAVAYNPDDSISQFIYDALISDRSGNSWQQKHTILIGDSVYYLITTNNSSVSFIDTLFSSIGSWIHIIYIYDWPNRTKKYYLNGLEKNSGVLDNYPATIAFQATVFGARKRPSNTIHEWFEGVLDDIGFWNRALDSTEIQQLYTLGQYDISWSTGDTTSSITVSPAATTTYSVTVDDGIGSCSDSVIVTVSDPQVNLGDTLSACGDSLLLDAGVGYNYYSWSTGESTQTIYATATGDYAATVGDTVAVSNNYSLEFDGVDGMVNVPQDNTLKLLGDLTIMMDINIPNTSPDWNHVISHGVFSPTDPLDNLNYFFQIPPNTTDLMYVHEYSTGINEQITCTVPLQLSQWSHLAIVRDTTNKSVKFYIEGILVDTQTYINHPENGANGSLSFGNIVNSTNGYLDGSLDNISLWNVALDSISIDNYSRCLPVGNEVGIVGYWNFEEGTGVSAQDLTSNANNGGLSGGVSWITDVHNQVCLSCTATDTVLVSIIDPSITPSDTAICLGDSVDLNANSTISFVNQFSIELDASNDYVYLLTDQEADLLSSSDFSIGLWFRSTSNSSGISSARIISRDCSEHWGLYVNQTQNYPQDLTLHYDETGNITFTNIIDSSWVYIYITWNQSTKETELFINGISQGKYTFATFNTSAPRPIILGENTETSPNPGISPFVG